MSRIERFCVPVFLIVFTGMVYWEATTFPTVAARFPKLLIASMFLLSLIFLVQEWKNRNVAHEEAPEKETMEPAGAVAFELVSPTARQILIIASMLVYMILLKYLGFLIATFLFLLVQFSLLGYRKKFTILMVSVCITVVTFFVFKKIFLIMFPEGVILPAIF